MRPFRPPAAPVTRALIVACIVVQLVITLGGDAFGERVGLQAGLIPARLSGAVAGLPWSVPAPLTLLTSLFLHAGWIHLALNLSFLGWVGRYVEWAVGRWRFVALYVLSGLAGGLLQFVVSPDSMVPVVGASGAISGVFGAYAVMFAQSRASARRVFGIAVSSDTVTALWYAATWIGLQLLTAVAFNAGGQGIAIWAHIGGFVTGLIFAQPFGRGRMLD
ncbi:MAG: rhomboid family intramembrane serine protease [Janthinobacterium lividum]